MFIITTVAIIFLLLTVSKWLEPTTIPDPSSTVSREEFFLMNNIIEKAEEVVNVSANEELNYSLAEYKSYVTKYMANKGYTLVFNYTINSYLPRRVTFNISLSSQGLYLRHDSVLTCPCPI